MIVTNKFNVPEIIFDKIVADLNSNPYDISEDDGICFRTTELLGPPLIRTLRNKFKDSDELVVDAVHYLAVLYGQQFHLMCEGKDNPDHFYEYKVKRSFEYKGEKVTIFGMIDDIELDSDKELVILTDNKTCMMSNLGYPKPEYEQQLNVYLFLLGDNVPSCISDNIIMQLRYFIKDWTPSKKVNALARASNLYSKTKAEEMPDSSIIYKPVPVFSKDRVESFIMGRIADHINNPERVCNVEERWDTLSKVAVMLTGNKTAKKLCKDLEAANIFIASLSPKDQNRAYTEIRTPGKHERDKRCQYYCGVSSVCPYALSKGYE